ncbi:MAG: hypothetical protein EAZ74_04790 [Alphaproteobacteria bacterium]|nr:MAG: hypothetical protein EAZ74_04790 [Alphaproteobacteria bacterium]
MGEVRGVREDVLFDHHLLRSREGKALGELTSYAQDIFASPAILTRKQQNVEVQSAVALYDHLMDMARKGLSIQRFKGLGEMNAEQLWDTTLDPQHRTLLQVKIEHSDDADQSFSILMGDVVEPRRQFIQDNALNVENLDI